MMSQKYPWARQVFSMMTRPSFSRTIAGMTLIHSGQTEAVLRGRPRGAWNSIITRAGILVSSPWARLDGSDLGASPMPVYITHVSFRERQKPLPVTESRTARLATSPRYTAPQGVDRRSVWDLLWPLAFPGRGAP